MLLRSLLPQNTRKICCNGLFLQIRYGSNYAKNADNKNTQLMKTQDTVVEKIRKRFPRLSAMYGLVYGGMRGIFGDLKECIRVSNKISEHDSLEPLTLEELEFIYNFKRNARTLLPIVALAVLPFGNAFIIPLVYFNPRKRVTYHFWTEHQRATFPVEDHKDRLEHRKIILDYMKQCPRGRIPENISNDWHKLLAKLDSGARPELSEIAKVSPMFHRRGPFYFQTLPKSHLIHLAATYGITTIFSPKQKMIKFAGLGMLMDKKIIERGGPKALSTELRSKICYMRGVDSMNMSPEEQIDYLQKWIKLNAKIDMSNYSLLLHTPILLGYNAGHDVLQKR
ncbi:LETM1 domain-containing protein 1-like [Planococcus citri]|uniref:LETM1 domain-containing protein 1-like n=1 Tax=Planococcus citri TaxID=170843 RepID=UPI0031F7F500